MISVEKHLESWGPRETITVDMAYGERSGERHGFTSITLI